MKRPSAECPLRLRASRLCEHSVLACYGLSNQQRFSCTKGRVGHLTGRSRQHTLVLALSLIGVEFLAGMQRYLSQTVLPLMASELNGESLYGPLNAAAQAPMFFMMPVGAWLLSRYKLGHLMLFFTMLTVCGATLCALAPSMTVFIMGTAVRAFASGALATVSMGAISKGLPERHRQLVLAGMSGIWLLSSILGPGYAVAAASLLGWRWAMVLYLPVLLFIRAVIARSMPERAEQTDDGPLPWHCSLLLAIGAAILAIPAGQWSAAAVTVGAALMLWAAIRLLPSGTLKARAGRPANLGALLLVAAVFFGGTTVLSVVAHDSFGLSAGWFGIIIAAPGLLWAITALWTGSHPALESVRFRRRAMPAGVAMMIGLLVLSATTVLADGATSAFTGLFIGASIAGAAMGSLYPDLLGRCLQRPSVDDGISEDSMAGAVVLAESIGLAISTTVAYSWLGTGWGFDTGPLQRSQVLYLALLPLAALMLRKLWTAARTGTTEKRSWSAT